MSTFVKHQSPKPKGLKLALFLGIVWLVLLAAMWFAYRNSEGDGGGIMNFIGRFHILIVHLPIGVIFLGAVMEILSRLTAFSHLRASLPFVHWIAFIGAIGATLVGYLLMSVEGFAGRAMDFHLYFGLAVVVTTFFAVFFSLKNQAFLSMLAAFAAVGTAMASGHFGGAMVHEGDYLVEHAPEPLKPFLLLGLETHSDADKVAVAAVIEEETAEIPLGDLIVYTDFVVPILEGKCTECHNENKVKGKLRMDTHELLLAGAEGSDFPTVVPGDAEQSEMMVRVLLPSDHDEFMPTKGEPLTPDEIELLSLWIQSGADTEGTIASLGDDPSIEATALAVKAGLKGAEEVADIAIATYDSVWDTLTPEDQQLRMDEVNDAAAKYHFSVMPISAEDDRLRINVINAAKEFGDDQLAMLEPVADRIVWLDLARSQVTDAGMETVGKMRALERLHLENTEIGDEGIAQLGSLTGLEYLNLYGTKVGNGIFATLSGLPNLKKLYVWQTNVEPGEARSFERSVNLEINTGVELAAVTPAVAPVEEAKPAEAAKPAPAPAPEKKEEPKPAATPAAKPAEPKKAEAKPAPTTPAATPAAAAPAKKPEPKPATPAAKPATPPAKAAAPSTPATPKPETKPATPAPKPEAKPAPKPTTPAAQPKPAADTPPAPKPEAKPAPAATPAPAKKADTPPAPKAEPKAE